MKKLLYFFPLLIIYFFVGIQIAAATSGQVSLTFDDGWKSIYVNAIPILNKAGIKSTQYIYTDPLIDAENYAINTYMTISDVLSMQRDGHEIGAHTRTHADLTKATVDLKNEIDGSKADLLKLGISSINSFSYPYGAYNQTVKDAVVAAGFMGARSVDHGYNSIDSLNNVDERFALKIQHVTNVTATSTIKSWIDEAVINNAWLILMFHEIASIYPNDCLGDDTSECSSKDVLQEVSDYLIDQKVCVLTISQVLSNESCNHAPELAPIGDKLVTANASITFTLLAEDSDSDTLNYTMVNAPASSSLDLLTGIFNWTPANDSFASTSVTFTVSDGKGGLDSETILINIVPETPAPVVVINDISQNIPSVASPVNSGGGVSGRRASVVTPILTSATTTGDVLGVASEFKFNTNLKLGMSTDDVIELQKRLTQEGLYVGEITGYFGPITLKGVKAYQAKYGIPQVGNVGPKTRMKLNEDGVVLGVSRVNIGGMTVEQMNTLLQKLQVEIHSLMAKLGVN